MKQFFKYSQALKLLLKRDIANRYKGTVMGFFWLILQPLIVVLVYSFVFSVILKVRIAGAGGNSYHFALYLMAAMMPFFAFQEALISASSSLFSNIALLHKSTLPPIFFSIVPILATVVTECIALLIIMVASVVLLKQLSWCLLLLPCLVLIRLFLSVGFGCMVAILSVFIQDLKQALGLMLTMLLFLTPVFYPVEMIPERFVPINQLNPFFHLLDAYRAVLIRGELPDIGILWVGLLSVLILFLGIWFFQNTIERAKDFV